MKTHILLMLFVFLVFSACRGGVALVEEPPEVVYEPEEEIPEEEEEEIYIPRITRVEGEFSAAGVTAPFFWDEEYFSDCATVFNPSLATMSLMFAMTTFASPRTENIDNLLGEIGFEDIEVNRYFRTAPHAHSMGVAVGHRYMQANGRSYTLIAVATRGGNYGIEWAGNMTVGTEGYHEGFRRGAVVTHEFLLDYITRHGTQFEENIKIWITGFSRAAAVASLTAAWLANEQEIGGFPISGTNIYAYAFATPRFVPGGQIQENHYNIHNIINPADLVVWVAPAGWDFVRYGVDYFLPERALTEYGVDYDIFMEQFIALDTPAVRRFLALDDFAFQRFDGAGLIPPRMNFIEGSQPTSAFLNELMTALSLGIPDRATYVMRLEEALQSFSISIVEGARIDRQLDEAFTLFNARFTRQNVPEVVRAFLGDGMRGLTDLVRLYLYESLVEAGIDVAGAAAIAEMITASFAYGGLDAALTLLHNLHILPAGHYSELLLAWLMNGDENFGGNPNRVVIPGYRRVRVDGASYVRVYNTQGVLVAAINNEGQPAQTDSHLLFAVGSNNQRIFYLPPNAGYRLTITPPPGPIWDRAGGRTTIRIETFCHHAANYIRETVWENVTDRDATGRTVVVPRYASVPAFTAGHGAYVLQ